jgi:hypothetical protein
MGRRGGVGSLINKTMALLERDVFLVIGDAVGLGLTSPVLGGGEGMGGRHSLVLHLCPIPNLDFNVFGTRTMIVMLTTVAVAAAAARQQLQPPGPSRSTHG